MSGFLLLSFEKLRVLCICCKLHWKEQKSLKKADEKRHILKKVNLPALFGASTRIGGRMPRYMRRKLGMMVDHKFVSISISAPFSWNDSLQNLPFLLNHLLHGLDHAHALLSNSKLRSCFHHICWVHNKNLTCSFCQTQTNK